LIADGFATTGRHNNESVTSIEDMANNFFLWMTEAMKAKTGLQYVVEVFNGHGDIVF
jgi:hypothetical protein